MYLVPLYVYIIDADHQSASITGICICITIASQAFQKYVVSLKINILLCNSDVITITPNQITQGTINYVSGVCITKQ